MFSCPRCQGDVPPSMTACPACNEPVSEFLRRYSTEPLDGKYRMLSILGVGGMGEVYKALHVHLGTTRVIKLMRPNIAGESDAHERFLREARLATRILHPNVAALFDFSGLPDGSFYMVWEHIDGINLRQFLNQRRFLPPAQGVRLATEALMGLDAIHRAGIVHRDISPENLMVMTDAEGIERIKIIDLGVAKQWTEPRDDETKTGIFVGKFKYCSPEQLGMLADGERIDGRADIYAFALTLYEMLTGFAPFQADTPHQYLVLHASHMPRPMKAANPDISVPPEVEAVVFRALRKDRDQRFATAAEFARALETALPAATIVDSVAPGSYDPTVVIAPSEIAPPVREGSGTRQRPLRSGVVDTATMRKRELSDQIAAATESEQFARADVILQTLRMHLGVQSETDMEFRRLKNELERAAAAKEKGFAIRFDELKRDGKARELPKLLSEREEKMASRYAVALKNAIEAWLRRRGELLTRVRSAVAAESFTGAAAALEELAEHLEGGSPRDEDFLAAQKLHRQAMTDSASRMSRDIAAAQAEGNIAKTRRLLTMYTSRIGEEIEKSPAIRAAEAWMKEVEAIRGAPKPAAAAPAVVPVRRSGRGGVIALLLILGLLGGAIAAAFAFPKEAAAIIRDYVPEPAKAPLLEAVERAAD